MATLGYEVLCADIDQRKIGQLARGELPFHEPGLPELLRTGLDSRRLRFSTSFEDAAAFGDVHFICTGTPQQPESGRADLTQVYRAIEALAPLVRRPCLVAGKSTVPVGTARDLAQRLAQHTSLAELAWNPEFLREGSAVADTLAPDRIVAGVSSASAEQVFRSVYHRQLADGVPLFVTDLETAELAKVSANAFLATKISFINALAEMCEKTGGNVRQLADIVGADPRIGSAYLRPGLGYGGGCLPKDVRAFMASAVDAGVGQSLAFLKEIDAINLRRRARTADLALEMADGHLAGVRICILGAAFKPGSDDVRDSPALDVAQVLHWMGAQVTVYDPAAVDSARRARPQLSYAASVRHAARDASMVLLLTEWPEFAALRPRDLSGIVASKTIIDGRNVLDPELWAAAGWVYRALGMAASCPRLPPMPVATGIGGPSTEP